jgi:hypothetical protein
MRKPRRFRIFLARVWIFIGIPVCVALAIASLSTIFGWKNAFAIIMTLISLIAGPLTVAWASDWVNLEQVRSRRVENRWSIPSVDEDGWRPTRPRAIRLDANGPNDFVDLSKYVNKPPKNSSGKPSSFI